MYCVFDVETTGLHATADVLSCAVARFDAGFRFVDSDYMLFYREGQAKNTAFHINKISDDVLIANKDCYHENVRKLFALLSNHIPVGYNVKFDISKTNTSLFGRFGMPQLQVGSSIDIMGLLRALESEEAYKKYGHVSGFKYNPGKLIEACTRYGITEDRILEVTKNMFNKKADGREMFHDARFDVAAESILFIKLMTKHLKEKGTLYR